MSTFSSGEPPAGESSSGFIASNTGSFQGAPGGREVALRIQPTVEGAYSHAWEILKTDFWSLLLIGFIAWLLGIAIESGLSRGGGGTGLLGSLYHVLIGGPINYGAAYAWLRAVRGEKPEVGDLFVPFQRHWVAAVIANLLVTIIIIVGLVLLIVPGIFLAVRLSFVPFLVVDEGKGPVDALTESFSRTAGYGWTIFGAFLLGVLIIIVGFILLIVGSIPATMLVYLAFASLYAAITARKSTAW